MPFRSSRFTPRRGCSSRRWCSPGSVRGASTGAVDHGKEVGIALRAVLDTIGLVEPDDPMVVEVAGVVDRRSGVTDIEALTSMGRPTLACEVVRRAAVAEH